MRGVVAAVSLLGVAAVTSPGCSSQPGTVVCTSANVELISASDYDRSCKADSDCVAVSEGNACYPCTLACPTAAINAGSLPRYRADVAMTIGAHEQGSCHCPAEGFPRCQMGVCCMGFPDCVVDASAGTPPDASGDASDADASAAPFCHQSLDAWCMTPNAGCVRDWASAVYAAVDGGPGCLVEVCGGYDVLAMHWGPYGVESYYDRATGHLVAVVGFNKYLLCRGGPPGFDRPTSCSSMSACDSLPDAGEAGPIGGDGAAEAFPGSLDSASE